MPALHTRQLDCLRFVISTARKLELPGQSPVLSGRGNPPQEPALTIRPTH